MSDGQTEYVESMKKQVGGDHYKKMAIQPIEFIFRNRLEFLEGLVIKYVSRHREKNGLEDLRKAKHALELLMDLEYSSNNSDTAWRAYKKWEGEWAKDGEYNGIKDALSADLPENKEGGEE